MMLAFQQFYTKKTDLDPKLQFQVKLQRVRDSSFQVRYQFVCLFNTFFILNVYVSIISSSSKSFTVFYLLGIKIKQLTISCVLVIDTSCMLSFSLLLIKLSKFYNFSLYCQSKSFSLFYKFNNSYPYSSSYNLKSFFTLNSNNFQSYFIISCQYSYSQLQFQRNSLSRY
ncbi:transmembrane protein, putative (macronuclear) [Tetrahymena thermophila SB210]|uniref:Transmembrane protein, putative n=1 Tax=Tetrahymena thermophila (strain SB210) TaxID=312017 RepID=W7X1P6_TETTS|nr:transmembrane protein, putative [Tetrahymena thermophila SB210]EWS71542.1 transmembrane protein, putative [Tetrahymena thermophila SB210]|eukprot:XP_012655925.1 transmembrane protein, putative [Tetrahymena thermophila SB210]